MQRLLLTLIFLCANSYATEKTSATFIDDNASQEVYARLIPSNEATLSSELNGTIKKIHFKPGMPFKKDDTLIEFDCMPIILELKQINATLKATLATLESNQALARHNSVSKLELKLSESEHEKVLAKKELLIYQQKKCLIKAPFSGEVMSLEVNAHESVQNNTPLISVVSNHDFEVQMYLSSSWLKDINIGTSFQLYLAELPNNTFFNGHLTKIVRQIDAASQSLLVFGKLKNNSKKTNLLSSGMSGHAKVFLSRKGR